MINSNAQKNQVEDIENRPLKVVREKIAINENHKEKIGLLKAIEMYVNKDDSTLWNNYGLNDIDNPTKLLEIPENEIKLALEELSEYTRKWMFTWNYDYQEKYIEKLALIYKQLKKYHQIETEKNAELEAEKELSKNIVNIILNWDEKHLKELLSKDSSIKDVIKNYVENLHKESNAKFTEFINTLYNYAIRLMFINNCINQDYLSQEKKAEILVNAVNTNIKEEQSNAMHALLNDFDPINVQPNDWMHEFISKSKYDFFKKSIGIKKIENDNPNIEDGNTDKIKQKIKIYLENNKEQAEKLFNNLLQDRIEAKKIGIMLKHGIIDLTQLPKTIDRGLFSQMIYNKVMPVTNISPKRISETLHVLLKNELSKRIEGSAKSGSLDNLKRIINGTVTSLELELQDIKNKNNPKKTEKEKLQLEKTLTVFDMIINHIKILEFFDKHQPSNQQNKEKQEINKTFQEVNAKLLQIENNCKDIISQSDELKKKFHSIKDRIGRFTIPIEQLSSIAAISDKVKCQLLLDPAFKINDNIDSVAKLIADLKGKDFALAIKIIEGVDEERLNNNDRLTLLKKVFFQILKEEESLAEQTLLKFDLLSQNNALAEIIQKDEDLSNADFGRLEAIYRSKNQYQKELCKQIIHKGFFNPKMIQNTSKVNFFTSTKVTNLLTTAISLNDFELADKLLEYSKEKIQIDLSYRDDKNRTALEILCMKKVKNELNREEDEISDYTEAQMERLFRGIVNNKNFSAKKETKDRISGEHYYYTLSMISGNYSVARELVESNGQTFGTIAENVKVFIDQALKQKKISEIASMIYNYPDHFEDYQRSNNMLISLWEQGKYELCFQMINEMQLFDEFLSENINNHNSNKIQKHINDLLFNKTGESDKAFFEYIISDILKNKSQDKQKIEALANILNFTAKFLAKDNKNKHSEVQEILNKIIEEQGITIGSSLYMIFKNAELHDIRMNAGNGAKINLEQEIEKKIRGPISEGIEIIIKNCDPLRKKPSEKISIEQKTKEKIESLINPINFLSSKKQNLQYIPTLLDLACQYGDLKSVDEILIQEKERITTNNKIIENLSSPKKNNAIKQEQREREESISRSLSFTLSGMAINIQNPDYKQENDPSFKIFLRLLEEKYIDPNIFATNENSPKQYRLLSYVLQEPALVKFEHIRENIIKNIVNHEKFDPFVCNTEMMTNGKMIKTLSNLEQLATIPHPIPEYQKEILKSVVIKQIKLLKKDSKDNEKILKNILFTPRNLLCSIAENGELDLCKDLYYIINAQISLDLISQSNLKKIFGEALFSRSESGNNLYTIAITQGNEEIAEWLINEASHIGLHSSDEAKKQIENPPNKNKNILMSLAADGKLMTKLFENKLSEYQSALLNVDSFGFNILHYAAENNDAIISCEVLNKLIKNIRERNGIKEEEQNNLITKLLNTKNQFGYTPLMQFVLNGNIRAVRQIMDLIKYHNLAIGINISDNNGNTAFHHAAALGSLEMVQEFLDLNNLNLDQINKDGLTAFHFARMRSSFDPYGLNPIKDDKGKEIKEDIDSIQKADFMKKINMESRFITSIRKEDQQVIDAMLIRGCSPLLERDRDSIMWAMTKYFFVQILWRVLCKTITSIIPGGGLIQATVDLATTSGSIAYTKSVLKDMIKPALLNLLGSSFYRLKIPTNNCFIGTYHIAGQVQGVLWGDALRARVTKESATYEGAENAIYTSKDLEKYINNIDILGAKKSDNISELMKMYKLLSYRESDLKREISNLGIAPFIRRDFTKALKDLKEAQDCIATKLLFADRGKEKFAKLKEILADKDKMVKYCHKLINNNQNLNKNHEAYSKSMANAFVNIVTLIAMDKFPGGSDMVLLAKNFIQEYQNFDSKGLANDSDNSTQIQNDLNSIVRNSHFFQYINSDSVETIEYLEENKLQNTKKEEFKSKILSTSNGLSNDYKKQIIKEFDEYEKKRRSRQEYEKSQEDVLEHSLTIDKKVLQNGEDFLKNVMEHKTKLITYNIIDKGSDALSYIISLWFNLQVMPSIANESPLSAQVKQLYSSAMMMVPGAALSGLSMASTMGQAIYAYSPYIALGTGAIYMAKYRNEIKDQVFEIYKKSAEQIKELIQDAGIVNFNKIDFGEIQKQIEVMNEQMLQNKKELMQTPAKEIENLATVIKKEADNKYNSMQDKRIKLEKGIFELLVATRDNNGRKDGEVKNEILKKIAADCAANFMHQHALQETYKVLIKEEVKGVEKGVS